MEQPDPIEDADKAAVRWLLNTLYTALSPEQRAHVETALLKTPHRGRLRARGYTKLAPADRLPVRERQVPATLELAVAELEVQWSSGFVPGDNISDMWWVGHVVHIRGEHGDKARVKVAEALHLSVRTVATYLRLSTAYTLEDLQDIQLPWSAVKLTLSIENNGDRRRVLRKLDQKYRKLAGTEDRLSVRKIQEELKSLKDKKLLRKQRSRIESAPKVPE